MTMASAIAARPSDVVAISREAKHERAIELAENPDEVTLGAMEMVLAEINTAFREADECMRERVGSSREAAGAFVTLIKHLLDGEICRDDCRRIVDGFTDDMLLLNDRGQQQQIRDVIMQDAASMGIEFSDGDLIPCADEAAQPEAGFLQRCRRSAVRVLAREYGSLVVLGARGASAEILRAVYIGGQDVDPSTSEGGASRMARISWLARKP
jgi:hypothetical protein